MFAPSYKISDLPVHEAGAILITLLASPPSLTRKSDHMRDFKALMGATLSSVASKGEELSFERISVKPFYAFTHEPRRDQILIRMNEGLRRRLQAAYIATHFLIEAESVCGGPPSKRLGSGFTLNELIKRLHETDTTVDPDNFPTRVWRPSKSVIHLAVALYRELIERKTRGISTTSLGDLIFDADLIANVLAWAPCCADLLVKSGAHVSHGELIKLH